MIEKDLIVKEFRQEMFDECVFPIFVIYNVTTLDYPGFYISRLFNLNTPTRYVAKCKTLEDIYRMLPEGLTRMLRQKNDDINIIESWF